MNASLVIAASTLTALTTAMTVAMPGGSTCPSKATASADSCSAATAAMASECPATAKCPATPKAMLAGYVGDMDIVQTALESGSFKTLAAALDAADLVDALRGDGPFTVFAPTDDAFAKLPKGTVESLLEPENRGLLTSILLYHVVPGAEMAGDVLARNGFETLNGQQIDVSVDSGKVMIDDATVLKADIKCTNGVIHVIDSVIMPSTKNIVETAVEAGSFKTLAAALGAAELVSVLAGDGPFTVFAPTDKAFKKLPAGTVETLLKPENRDQLVAVLTYHVVPGRVYAADAAAAQTAATAQGESIRIRIKDGRLMVNDATVVATDIEATNGVIHVIDRVILPSSN